MTRTTDLLYRVFRQIEIIGGVTERYTQDKLTGELTPSQWGVLNRLYFVGAQTLSELADAFCVSRPSMSQMIGRLNKQGLIEETQNERDARSKLIALSSSGCEEFETIKQSYETALAPLAAKFTPASLENLLSDLESLEVDLAREVVNSEDKQ